MLNNITFSLLAMMIFSSTAFASDYVSVSKSGVNIRAKPSTKSDILWEVLKGFPLKVLERKNQWTHVQDFEGDKGWIYSPLLSKQNTLITKVNKANLRSGPGKNHKIVSTIEYGVIFNVEAKEDQWLKVRKDDGTAGWLFETLVWPNDAL